MYITNTTSTYNGGTIDSGGNKYQKVNRLFAVKNGVTLYKVKIENGVARKALFPNAPKNAYVYNGDLTDFDMNSIEIDYEFYNKLVENVLERG
jgi:hypothetical protein